ncbi:MAG: CBS domain-containing protein [Candidatus Hodarchaeales archaeon]|jgi:CBS domain-containing protein
MGMLVKDCMTKDVISLPVTKSIKDAVSEMIKFSVSSIVIIDADNRPVGLITAYDILELENNESDSREESLEKFKKSLISVTEEEKMEDAAKKFLDNNIHHLVVVDENFELTGVLSTFDLSKIFS